MNPDSIPATIIAIISGIGLLVTSFRRRQDTTVEELQNKIKRQRDEITRKDEELDEMRAELDEERKRVREARDETAAEQEYGVVYRRTIARLRRTLSDHEVPDPTVAAKENEERD